MSTNTTRPRTLLPASPAATRDILVLLLAFTAGNVDAVSYLGLGRVFTANMTGNTVLLGLSLAQAQWPAALRSALALAGYLVGVAGGALLIDRVARKGRTHTLWPRPVTIACTSELVILAALTLAAALLPVKSAGAVDVLIMPAAAAMGLQGVAVRALGIRGVATTYITGTWTTMMAGLVSTLPRAAQTDAEPPPGTGIQAAVVGVYLLAAVVGGFTASRWQLTAFTVPTVAIAFVVVVAWLRFRERID